MREKGEREESSLCGKVFVVLFSFVSGPACLIQVCRKEEGVVGNYREMVN